MPYRAGVVTGANFNDKMLAFDRASHKPGSERSVLRPSDPLAWAAWCGYLNEIGKGSMARLAESLGMLAVPTRYPWEFTVGADPWREKAAESLAAVKSGPAPAPISDEQRMRLAQGLRDVIPRDLVRAGHKPRRPDNRLPAGPAERGELTVSPEFRSLLSQPGPRR